MTITHMWWKQKSFYINCTLSFFHKTDSDIWASFGLKTESSKVLLKYPTFKGLFLHNYIGMSVNIIEYHIVRYTDKNIVDVSC